MSEENNETEALDALRDAVVLAACKWHSADIYVHPVLSRAEAVKVGVCDLIDAVQQYQNAKASMEPASTDRSGSGGP